MGGPKTAILAQVGHFYSDEVGQVKTGANNIRNESVAILPFGVARCKWPALPGSSLTGYGGTRANRARPQRATAGLVGLAFVIAQSVVTDEVRCMRSFLAHPTISAYLPEDGLVGDGLRYRPT